jgi:hypothetical protein
MPKKKTPFSRNIRILWSTSDSIDLDKLRTETQGKLRRLLPYLEEAGAALKVLPREGRPALGTALNSATWEALRSFGANVQAACDALRSDFFYREENQKEDFSYLKKAITDSLHLAVGLRA